MKLFNMIILLCAASIMSGCVPGAPLSDPLCLDCYYDGANNKMYTGEEWAKLHPDKVVPPLIK